MTTSLAIITLLFFITAILYTSVGFGGGSTYLAILVAANFNYQNIPTLALLCNIVAVTNGCYIFAKRGYLSWKHIGPFLILSIPMAFLGALIPIPKSTFLILVAISLSLAAWRMLIMNAAAQNEVAELSYKKSLAVGLPVGAVLGLLAGITGLAVLVGSQIGPRLSSTHWRAITLQRLTAVLMLLVSARIFWQTF